jgi:hypothetical protein
MIYHGDKKYLFVHIQKTGGTSVTKALMNQAGAEFISPPHILLRSVRPDGEWPFVFGVVRNPWERLVSWFAMMERKGVHNAFSKYLMEPLPGRKRVSFSEFIRRTAVIRETEPAECIWSSVAGIKLEKTDGYLKSIAFNQIDYFIDHNGIIRCDLLIDFNKLKDGFRYFLGLFDNESISLNLDRLNTNPLSIQWQDYYGLSEDREWVAHLYDRDIARFGYTFYGDSMNGGRIS